MASLSCPIHEPSPRRFRSWGETQIGRLLDRHGIAYLYEHPLAIVDRGKTRIWYPDFQLCGYGMLIEYFGRPHDPSYAAGMVRKRTTYEANGLTALLITPDQFRGNWPARVLGRIEKVLTGRVQAFRGARAQVARRQTGLRIEPSGR